jgi:two-component system, chemotaxis family, response regulator Rcp1
LFCLATHESAVIEAKHWVHLERLRGEEMLIEVLLVEDSPGDIRPVQEAFLDASKRIHFRLASDGFEAMAFQRKEGIRENAPRPDFILLDLNLPRMDGREVLGLIKGDEAIKNVPAIILTTSSADEDIVKSYRLQAHCNLSRPEELNEFEAVVKSINGFWPNTATLPKDKESQ